MAVFYVLFFTFGDCFARENAYLACFIDDSSFMFRSEVIYSGTDIEAKRVSPALFLRAQYNKDITALEDYKNAEKASFSASPLYITNDVNSRVKIRSSMFYGTYKTKDGVVDSYCYFPSDADVASNGIGSCVNYLLDEENNSYLPTNVVYTDGTGLDKILEGLADVGTAYPETPLTFPATKAFDESKTISTSDINRAYEVQSAICEDFKNALLFLNNGNSFTSVEELSEMAFYLVTSEDGATIKNKEGTTFVINFTDSSGVPFSDETGYLYYINITDNLSGTTNKFCWKIKKGYTGCNYGERMENGNRNSLNVLNTPGESEIKLDTMYISWEHLFLEAQILYAQGISYANQADIYNIDDLESSITKLVRNILGGLDSKLSLYSIEDCLFNTGVRGTSAFVSGVYNSSRNVNIIMIYLIFLSITLSLIVLRLIMLVSKKQYSTVSPTARISLMDGVKDLIIALVIIGMSIPLFKLLITANFKFVSIWATFVNDNSLSDKTSGLSTIPNVIYQFAFFIIKIYINFVYIIRQISVPILMATSPVFIYCYSWGINGKRMANAWLKEMLGNIFIQSFHAFVYGFIIMSSSGLRGIEKIIICYSIIPLTHLIKEIVGIGGDKLLKQAASATNNTAMIGSAINTIPAQALGSAAGAVGNTFTKIGSSGKVSHGVGTALNITGGVLNSASGAANTFAGIKNAGIGAGLSTALGDEGRMGLSLVSSGTRQMTSGLGQSMGGVSQIITSPLMARNSYSSRKSSGGDANGGNGGGNGGGNVPYTSFSNSYGRNFNGNQNTNFALRFSNLGKDYNEICRDMRYSRYSQPGQDIFTVRPNNRNYMQLEHFREKFENMSDVEKQDTLNKYGMERYEYDADKDMHLFTSKSLDLRYEGNDRYLFNDKAESKEFVKQYNSFDTDLERQHYLGSFGYSSFERDGNDIILHRE